MSNKAFAINTANAVSYLIGELKQVCEPYSCLMDRRFLARGLTSAVCNYIQECEAWRGTYDPGRARNCTDIRGLTNIRKQFDSHIRALQTHGPLPFSRETYQRAVLAFNKVREWIVDAVAEYISVEEWQVCYTKAHTTTVTVELLGDYRVLDWEYRRKMGEFVHDGELTDAHIEHLVKFQGLRTARSVEPVVLPTDDLDMVNAAGDVLDSSVFKMMGPLGGMVQEGRSEESDKYARENNSDLLLTRVKQHELNTRKQVLFDDLHSMRLVGHRSRTPLGSAKQIFTVAFGNYPEIANKINKSPELRAKLRLMGWDGDLSKFTEEMAALVLYGIAPAVYQYLRPIVKPTGLQDEKDNLSADTTSPAPVSKYSGFRFTTTPGKSQ